MLRVSLWLLRSSKRQRGGTNKADDVFSFFTTPPAYGSVGLEEFAVPICDAHNSMDNSGVPFPGAGIGVTRIASDAQLATAIASTYDPVVYAYSLFDYVTIEEALAPKLKAHGWKRRAMPLLSPYALIAYPQPTLRALPPLHGEVLMETLCELLQTHDREAPASLVRCARHLLGMEAVPATAALPSSSVSSTEAPAPPCADMVSFLRGLLLCSATQSTLTAQASFVLDALIHDGGVEDTALTLPGEYEDRCVSLTDLLLQASTEFGSEAMLHAALLLMQQSGQEISLSVCKMICLAQFRAERRGMDWAYKSALPSRGRSRKKSRAPQQSRQN